MKKVAVSGGFDPIHIGHLRLLKEAKEIGDHLTVILNSDKFLIEKKGFCFMPFEERKEILLSVAEVDKVVESIDKDQTVIETIKKLSIENAIDVFANGEIERTSKIFQNMKHVLKIILKWSSILEGINHNLVLIY